MTWLFWRIVLPCTAWESSCLWCFWGFVLRKLSESRSGCSPGAGGSPTQFKDKNKNCGRQSEVYSFNEASLFSLWLKFQSNSSGHWQAMAHGHGYNLKGRNTCIFQCLSLRTSAGSKRLEFHLLVFPTDGCDWFLDMLRHATSALIIHPVPLILASTLRAHWS